MYRATKPLSQGPETCPSLARKGYVTWHSGGAEAGRWGQWEVGVLLAGFASLLPSAMCVGFEVPVFYICQLWATCFPALSFPHGYPFFFSHSPFSLYSLCLSLFASPVGLCMNRPTSGTKHFNKKAGPFKFITFSSSSLALLPRSEVETPLSFCVVIPSAQRGCCVYNNPIILQCWICSTPHQQKGLNCSTLV